MYSSKRGTTIFHHEPKIIGVAFTNKHMHVTLLDGRVIAVPISWSSRLLAGTPDQRNSWEIIGEGEGIHWEELDEDLSYRGILNPSTCFTAPVCKPAKKQKQQPRRVKKHIAQVVREGKFFAITFEDGRVTQGRNRPEALVMAADLRACVDERDASHYYARWDAADCISVVVVP